MGDAQNVDQQLQAMVKETVQNKMRPTIQQGQDVIQQNIYKQKIKLIKTQIKSRPAKSK